MVRAPGLEPAQLFRAEIHGLAPPGFPARLNEPNSVDYRCREPAHQPVMV